jgi:GDPmannose 4,6-dehydratase
MKKALIFGATGQDGAYLSKFLLKKKYQVHGVKRKSSSYNTERLDSIFEKNKNFYLHYGDLTDSISIQKIISLVKPDEIYNLAAQSHVAVSFQMPEYTCNVNALGTLRILDSIKILNYQKKTKFYQAGTSELFGKVQTIPQNEKTPFYPRSPYAVSKLFSHWISKNYREAYGMYICNGILFNHESPLRGETFVTRKVTIGLAKIKLGIQKKLILGNIDAKRDWGHAKDYVKAMWKMLQLKKPDDYVISTDRQYSVKDFINEVAINLGIKLIWKGSGLKTKATNELGEVIITSDKKYFRPAEVETLLGDSSFARKTFNWKPSISFKMLVKEMTKKDLEAVKKKYGNQKKR